LPLNKPAHIDNEAALWKSTVVSKNLHDDRNAGKSYFRPTQVIKIGNAQNDLGCSRKAWVWMILQLAASLC